MIRRNHLAIALSLCGAAWFFLSGSQVHADDAADTQRQLQQLREQNEKLQEQLRQQQLLIESLSRTVGEIQATNALRSQEIEHLESAMKDASLEKKPATGFNLGKVNLSAEGGVGFFESGSQGAYPNSEFRVDEAKLFIEAPVWDQVYSYAEINLTTRESSDFQVELGECYLDFENVSRLWHRDRMLNVRAGRMDIPFGEEYLTRDAIDNPLISHSLTDFWGVDQGLELYGSLGKFTYVAAVQNGGAGGTADYDSDKAVSGRIGYDPASWLHLSASGMRTGDLNTKMDDWSQLWFANGWLMPFGAPGANRVNANLAEGDVEFRLPHGHVHAFGGYAHQEDNDPAVNNRRDIYFYSVEAVHDLVGKLYAGARFSQIFAPKGYPIAANGSQSKYLFSGLLTDEIWRLTLGLGYRFSQNLLLKAEYSFERGTVTNGENRDQEDLFAVEAAFKF